VRVEEGSVEELYWRFLAAAVALAFVATWFTRDTVELRLQLGAATLTALSVWQFLR
jgi:hypothetical protein